MAHEMKVEPLDITGSHKTGSLSHKLTAADIEFVLGFPANVADDTDKVTLSWGFTVNGKRCGIWDYNGSRWSTYDPDGVLPDLFAEITAKVGGA